LRRDVQKLPYAADVSFLRISMREIVMRPVIAVFLTCLALAACGSDRKTVVVNPPPGSTTVVDSDGHTKIIEH